MSGFRRRLVRQPQARLGLILAALLILIAVLAPWLAPESATAADLSRRLQPPGAAHWFGTDELGRDLFGRVLLGARLTLQAALLVTLAAMPAGVAMGMIAGYLGGWIDQALMRLTDIVLAFPRLILALALVAALGPGLENAILAIGLTAWPAYARVARAETLGARQAEFVLAARTMGASRFHILRRHILPLCAASALTRMTLDMAGIVLAIAGLGFLGLGAQPPAPEWGAMVAGGRAFLLDQWWVATLPGLAILLTALAFNLLGDGLRDLLDPRGADD